MKQTTYSKFFAAAMLGLAIGAAQAGGIDALKKFNADADGLSGSFSQTVKNKKKTQTSGGTFQIMRPGLFRWEYSKPYKQTIVGDGQHIWLYDVDLKQVTKSDQSQAIGDSPASILSDKNALDSSYSLKEDGSGDGIDYVLATPKKNNAGYQFIRIGLQGRHAGGNGAERRFRQSDQHQIQQCEHPSQLIARQFQIRAAQRCRRVESINKTELSAFTAAPNVFQAV